MSFAGDVTRGVLVSVLVSILSLIIIIGLLYLFLKFGVIPYFESRLPEGMVEFLRNVFGGRK